MPRKAKQQRCRKLGVCISCCGAHPKSGCVTCIKCLRKIAVVTTTSRLAAKAAGRCIDCIKQPAAPNRVRCEGCLKRSAEYAVAYRAMMKAYREE